MTTNNALRGAEPSALVAPAGAASERGRLEKFIDNAIKGISRNLRPLVFAALASVAVLGCKSQNGEQSHGAPSIVQSEEGAGGEADSGVETSDEIDFQKIAAELEKHLENLDQTNRERLQKVIDLLKTNLEGIKIERSTFEESPRIRAQSSYPRHFDATGDLSITLNEEWRADNGLDLTFFVHEVWHLVEIIDARKNLDIDNWTKIYGAPGVGTTEIRSELSAWELSLELLNSLSDQSMAGFHSKLSGAVSQAEANRLVGEYAKLVREKTGANLDQMEIIERWLQIYFNLKFADYAGLDCRWSYNFASQVASEYKGKLFELSQLSSGANPRECIYPLDGGPYPGFFPYEDYDGHGLWGPAQKMVPFNR